MPRRVDPTADPAERFRMRLNNSSSLTRLFTCFVVLTFSSQLWFLEPTSLFGSETTDAKTPSDAKSGSELAAEGEDGAGLIKSGENGERAEAILLRTMRFVSKSGPPRPQSSGGEGPGVRGRE